MDICQLSVFASTYNTDSCPTDWLMHLYCNTAQCMVEAMCLLVSQSLVISPDS